MNKFDTHKTVELRTTSKWLNAISVSVSCPYSTLEEVSRLPFITKIELVNSRSNSDSRLLEHMEFTENIESKATLPKYGPNQQGKTIGALN